MGFGTLKQLCKEDNPQEYSKISKLFKVKYEHNDKGEFKKIDLDNIYPNEIINQNNIGSYIRKSRCHTCEK